MVSTAAERRARILGAVDRLGTVRVIELAAHLGIPVVTLRRDLAALTADGRLHRSHGVVSSPSRATAEQPERPPVVGMLVPTVGSYFDEIIAGARAASAGARLVLGISSYQARDDRAQVEHLLGSAVDGLLLSPHWLPGSDSPLDWLADLPVPAVLIERRGAPGAPAVALDTVASDHRHGVLLALRHLAALGHCAVLLAARDDSWTAHQVRAGYAEAVRRLGLDPQPVLDIRDPGAPGEGPGGIERLADRIAAAAGTGVRAVLVHNDHEAVRLSMLLRARGLRLPEDLALISYDDVFAALAAPPLTAVAPPRRAVGATAMALLLRRLEGEADLPAHRIDLLPELKVRGSCGAIG
ncbi:substrate-binding domain-containing protein [Kitasatospora sp. NBC_01266]|uniref:substrate-binding domain-containing protein n=1 Tax=Kitasatospora sp. NBC_01266 TaxID=2903572 RepID=UPI002E36D6AE|nr:substrate-binding domain-containing protein [Kitasatospora sp. NBC_01266]